MDDERGAGGEYPDRGEIVIGTVDSIFKQGAFITLDEYGNKRGLLHISEISLKWVRNIRDYVKEGQKAVLQVLKVNPARGHIDLSLRRVSDVQRREKLQEVRQKQRSKKLLAIFAKSKGVSKEEIDIVSDKLSEEYESVYDALESIAANNSLIDELDIKDGWKKDLMKLINENIKISFVEITGYVNLRSYQPDGIEQIKKALKEIEKYETDSEDSKITVQYDSPPLYRINVKSNNYKSAEKILRNSAEKGIDTFKKNGGKGEFYRELPVNINQ